MKLLEVKNLTKKFHGLVANNQINFHVDEGEIVGLIGPNGAGKTTLFGCISGLHPPTQGRIVFAGEDITSFKPSRICKRGIARTFQLVDVFKEMTVIENVMAGAFCGTSSQGIARKESMRGLEFVGLLEYQNILAGNLTIVNQKRLELARALATKPKLLMLDEVMAGLNAVEMNEAVNLIRRLYDEGITLFIVEHVMEAIMPIADRVIVLNAGKKIAEGNPQEISQNEEVIEAYLGRGYHA